MILNEEKILIQMDKLSNPHYKASKYEDLIAWVNSVINLLKSILSSSDPQIEIIEKALKEYISGDLYYGDRQKKLESIVKGIIITGSDKLIAFKRHSGRSRA